MKARLAGGLPGLTWLGLALVACQPHAAPPSSPDAAQGPSRSSAHVASAMTPEAPCFIEGLEASGASEADRITLQQAQTDFCAVLAGREPVHARLDTESPVPADGGTQFYVAPHYQLSVVRRLASFGQAQGMVVGPVLTFSQSFAPGNSQTISATRIVLSPAR